MQFIFWLSVAVIIYAYIGYPMILTMLSFFLRKPVQQDESYCPRLSLIITVHNEQDRVLEKIINTLALEYPEDKLEIIFASDASTDKTEEIIQSYSRLKLVRSPERRGKEFAQKCAVDQSSGEILVFSDVATIIEPEGLCKIAGNFSDSTVGCVSSEDKFIDDQGRISGEGAYVKYEMFLRRLESKVYSLVGLSGSFFAARREVCVDWAVDLQSDFNTLLNSLKLGLRGISDPQSLGWYRNIADEKKEFNRKVRTVVRGLSVLMRNLNFFNPFQYGVFSWQLFSHKLCRWLVPFFLLVAFLSNVLILTYSRVYIFLLGLQIIFYLLAGFYYIFESKSGLPPVLKIPYYFIVVNAAILKAWVQFFRGERAVYWEPSKR